MGKAVMWIAIWVVMLSVCVALNKTFGVVISGTCLLLAAADLALRIWMRKAGMRGEGR